MSETNEALKTHLSPFISKMMKRIGMGQKKYGDAWTEMPISQLIEEVEAELLDIPNYCLFLYIRLQKLKAQLSRLDSSGNQT
jgi:hypothetical protein